MYICKQRHTCADEQIGRGMDVLSQRYSCDIETERRNVEVLSHKSSSICAMQYIHLKGWSDEEGRTYACMNTSVST